MENKNSVWVSRSPRIPVSRPLLLTEESFPSVVRESYNSIRTNLLSLLSGTKNESKQICFTSPAPADGKTLNCANIAITFAEMGANVLLVDADMRKPRLHRIFRVSSEPGLSECLIGSCAFDKAILPCKEKGLYLLPAGKALANPTDLILSDRFDALLESFAPRFEYVFIDAPPVGLFTDAAIISRKTLGAVLVCKSGSTRIDSAHKAKEAITQGGGHVIGALLNGVDLGKYGRAKKRKSGYAYDYEAVFSDEEKMPPSDKNDG